MDSFRRRVLEDFLLQKNMVFKDEMDKMRQLGVVGPSRVQGKHIATYDLSVAIVHNALCNDPSKDYWKSVLLRKVQNAAKRRGLEFDLVPDDLGHRIHRCPIFPELVLDYSPSRKDKDSNSARENAASLDRIDSALGYVAGNVQILSWKANQTKNSLSLHQMVRFVNLGIKSKSLDPDMVKDLVFATN